MSDDTTAAETADGEALTDDEVAALPKKPVIRADCANVPRPCPFVGCPHHLYLDYAKDARTKHGDLIPGKITYNHPGKEWHELEHSCALDVATEGEHTLSDVAELIGITRSRAQQIEDKALRILESRGLHVLSSYADRNAKLGDPATIRKCHARSKKQDAEDECDDTTAESPTDSASRTIIDKFGMVRRDGLSRQLDVITAPPKTTTEPTPEARIEVPKKKADKPKEPTFRLEQESMTPPPKMAKPKGKAKAKTKAKAKPNLALVPPPKRGKVSPQMSFTFAQARSGIEKVRIAIEVGAEAVQLLDIVGWDTARSIAGRIQSAANAEGGAP